MTNASKVKGNSAERELCKFMIKKFGGSWVRVPNSGGMVGGLRNARAKTLSKSQLLNQSNDIVPPDEYPHCALECKFYKDFSFNLLMDPKGYSKLNEWIDQVKESGIDMQKNFPMICFKINRLGWHTVVWSSKIKNFNIKDINHVIYNYKGEEFKIFEMESFMDRYLEELKKCFR